MSEKNEIIQRKIRETLKAKEREVEVWRKISELPPGVISNIFGMDLLIWDKRWSILNEILYSETHPLGGSVTLMNYIHMRDISSDSIYEYLVISEKISNLIEKDNTIFSNLEKLVERKIKELMDSGMKTNPKTIIPKWRITDRNFSIYNWKFEVSFDGSELRMCVYIKFTFDLKAKNSKLDKDGVGEERFKIGLIFDESSNKILIGPEEKMMTNFRE